MSFKLSVPPGSAFWLPSWLGIGVAVESVGVAAVADDVAAAAAVLLLAGAAAVVAAAPVAPADPAVVVSRELLVTGAAGPSVVSIKLLCFLVGIDGLALLSSVMRISVGLVISLMVMFQLNPAG